MSSYNQNNSSDEEKNYIEKIKIKDEIQDIKFHNKVMECCIEMKKYINEKYLPIGQKINSGNLLEFIINEMEGN